MALFSTMNCDAMVLPQEAVDLLLLSAVTILMLHVSFFRLGETLEFVAKPNNEVYVPHSPERIFIYFPCCVDEDWFFVFFT
jgi:hypothetical protein